MTLYLKGNCVQAVFSFLTAVEKHILLLLFYWQTGSVSPMLSTAEKIIKLVSTK